MPGVGGGMAETHTPALDPGSVVGPYEIQELLGEGGMGRVYRAVRQDGEEVALKLVKLDLARDAVFRKRFEREASAATLVSHRHVVAVIDKGEHDGQPYLAQRFVRGGSLEQKIEREGPLPLEATVRICLHLAGGLDALHEAGLVHRDLKPANVMLDADGSASITDFGLAKVRDASLLTKPGQALGSMDYMAPEQIRGEEVTAATDVYALGCVMFQCLSGDPPFADREGMRILWAHLQEEPADPCATRTDLPADVSWAVLSALAKEPERRPPTATAYARMVQVAAGVPPLSPGGES